MRNRAIYAFPSIAADITLPADGTPGDRAAGSWVRFTLYEPAPAASADSAIKSAFCVALSGSGKPAAPIALAFQLADQHSRYPKIGMRRVEMFE
jgi:hypothetical protein